MVDQKPAFIVKDRIEVLEKVVDKILDVDGLKALAKDTTKSVLDEALESSKVELRDAARSSIQEAKEFILSEKSGITVDLDERLKIARSDFQKALVEHLENVETRISKVERLVKIAIAVSLASALWSGLIRFI